MGIAQIAVRPPNATDTLGHFFQGIFEGSYGYNSKKKGTNHTGKDLDPPPKRTIGLGEKSKVEKRLAQLELDRKFNFKAGLFSSTF